MNKRVGPIATTPHSDPQWLNLQDVEVELTSEDPNSPIEGALLPDRSTGWRASGPGPQTIRLTWREPVRLSTVRLIFEEHTRSRTQEFVLRAITVGGGREIVRQQFTFSPPATAVEREDYGASLDGVTGLELTIIPAIDGSDAVASMKEWRAA